MAHYLDIIRLYHISSSRKVAVGVEMGCVGIVKKEGSVFCIGYILMGRANIRDNRYMDD